MVRSLARWPGGSGGGSSAAAAAAVNVGEAANICATNALARALLGRPVFEEREEAREFKEMVVELMRLAGVFNVGDFVPWIAWLDPQGVVKKMKRLHRRYRWQSIRIIIRAESSEFFENSQFFL